MKFLNTFGLYLNHFRSSIRQDNLTSLAVILVVFMPLAMAGGFINNIEISKLLVWLISLIILLGIVIWRKIYVQIEPKLIIIYSLFLIICFVSTFVNGDIVNSVFGNAYERYNFSLLMFFMLGVTGFVFYQVPKARQFKFVLVGAVAVSSLISILGIAQYFGFAYYGGIELKVRTEVYSFLGNPNFSSMYIAMLLPINLWLFLISKNRAKIIYGLIILLNIVGLGFFNSRGALLAGLVGLIIYGLGLVFRKEYKNLFVTMLISALLVLIGGVFYLNARDDSVQIGEKSNEYVQIDPRNVAISYGYDATAKNPWLGVGPSNLYKGYLQEVNFNLGARQVFDDVHNVFLQVSGQLGLPALSLLLLLLALTIYYGAKSVIWSESLMVFAVTSGLVAFLIAGSFNPVVESCWVLGCLFVVGIWKFSSDRGYAEKNYKIMSMLQKLVAFFICLILIYTFIVIIVQNSVTDKVKEAYSNEKNYEKVIELSNISQFVAPYLIGGDFEDVSSKIYLGKSEEEIISGIERIIPRVEYYNDYVKLSSVYFQMYKKYEDELYKDLSEKYADIAVEKAPTVPYVYYRKALTMYYFGKFEEAKASIYKAIVVDGSNLEYWSLLAKLNQNLNNKEGVIYALKNASIYAQQKKAYTYFIDLVEKSDNVKDLDIPISFQEPRV